MAPLLRSAMVCLAAGALLTGSNVPHAPASLASTHPAGTLSTPGRLVHADIMPHMYSLLQLSARMSDTERMAAGQVFELIEDPLLNLLVPVIIQIVMGIVQQPIIDMLCDVLGTLIPDLVAAPMGDAIFPGVDTSSLESFIELESAEVAPRGGVAFNYSAGLVGADAVIDRLAAVVAAKVARYVTPAVSAAEAALQGGDFAVVGSPLLAPFALSMAETDALELALERRGLSLAAVRDAVQQQVRRMAILSRRGGGADTDSSSTELSLSRHRLEEDEPEEDDEAEGADLAAQPHPGLHLDALWARERAERPEAPAVDAGELQQQQQQQQQRDAEVLAYGAFLELHESATPCKAAKTARACNGMQPPTVFGRCAWCAKGGTGGGACVPCEAARVKKLAGQGYQCSRDEAFCDALSAHHWAHYDNGPTPTPAPKDAPVPATNAPENALGRLDWLPVDETSLPAPPAPPKGDAPPNEATAQLARTLNDGVVASATHLLQAGLVPVLRARMRDKLVRGIMRGTAAGATAGVVAGVHAALPALLLTATTAATTRRVGAELTRALASSLTPTLAEALARHPALDVMCFLCTAKQLYCGLCAGARTRDAGATAFSWDLAQVQAEAATRHLAVSGIVDVAAARAVAEEGAAVAAAAAKSK